MKTPLRSLSRALVMILAICMFCLKPQHVANAAESSGRGWVIVSCTAVAENDDHIASHTPYNNPSGPIAFSYSADSATSKKNGVMGSNGTLYSVPLFRSGFGDFEGNPTGTLYAIQMKPGDYMFLAVSAYLLDGLIRPPRSFRVQPGMVTYIGNIQYVQIGERSNNECKYRVEVKDMRDRDLSVFQKKYPKLKNEQIEFALMKGEPGWEMILRGRRTGPVFSGADQAADQGYYRLDYEKHRDKTNAVVKP
jgi:hypothetical protein